MATLEEILRSLARRILALDEDELVRLIPKYRKRMENFTPNTEWEESVIIYFIINGFRVKSAQYTEELKTYIKRKNRDSGWAKPQKPDIRQVFAKITDPGAQPNSPEASAGPGPAEASGLNMEVPESSKPPERPDLRLIRPKKEN
ncbi:MAG: hypothetical protein LBK52_05340 [Deltaproteobacteria bacterium]|jgi:hypothetical protein|nr:hypothetical protein [Deltaproteobacteria bacterium]